MAEIEIGMGKSGRRAYGLGDVALVPSRRTRDPRDVDLSWEIDAFRFDLPVMGAAMDSVTSPASAATLGRLGGVGVLALEGLWTRYDDPEPLLREISRLDPATATPRLQEIYAEPIRAEHDPRPDPGDPLGGRGVMCRHHASETAGLRRHAAGSRGNRPVGGAGQRGFSRARHSGR